MLPFGLPHLQQHHMEVHHREFAVTTSGQLTAGMANCAYLQHGHASNDGVRVLHGC